MKLITERRKHQVIGIVVVASLVWVFFPSLFKRSDGLDETIHLSLSLPQKPSQPEVAIPQEKEMFQTVRVAHVNLSEPFDRPQLAKRASKAMPINESIQVVEGHEKNLIKAVQKTSGYAVQLASFSIEKNAESLVNRLKKSGYRANYTKFNSKNGYYYKVVVGQEYAKEEAEKLQKKLAEHLNLQGFIIKTGVS